MRKDSVVRGGRAESNWQEMCVYVYVCVVVMCRVGGG